MSTSRLPSGRLLLHVVVGILMIATTVLFVRATQPAPAGGASAGSPTARAAKFNKAKGTLRVLERANAHGELSTRVLRDTEAIVLGSGGRFDTVVRAREIDGVDVLVAAGGGKICTLVVSPDDTGSASCATTDAELDRLKGAHLGAGYTVLADGRHLVTHLVPDGTAGCTATGRDGAERRANIEGNVAAITVADEPSAFACVGPDGMRSVGRFPTGR